MSTRDPPQLIVGRASPQVLLYSTEAHGCSLRMAYSRLHESGPSLLVVLDTDGHLFGGYAPLAWHVSSHYFGTGEAFLFSAHPQWRVYPWSGANTLYQLGSSDSIAFGGGGQFGLWLDQVPTCHHRHHCPRVTGVHVPPTSPRVTQAFEHGSSGRSDTFGNEPLSASADFRVLRIEVWGFKQAAGGMRTPCNPPALSEARRAFNWSSESLASASYFAGMLARNVSCSAITQHTRTWRDSQRDS